MNYEKVTCFVVSCSNADCDPWADTDYEVAPHWSSLAAARRELQQQGWVIIGDTWLCPDCAKVADCALTGHQMVDWARLPGEPGTETRWCGHCFDAHEERPYVGARSDDG